MKELEGVAVQRLIDTGFQPPERPLEDENDPILGRKFL